MSKIIQGQNDLATTHTEIAAEQHPTKNGSLLPSNVMKGSGKKVWWKCKERHEWPVTVASRVLNGNGCPFCYKDRVKAKKSN